MPAVFDSLVHNMDLTPHVAWRVAFIVPFILIMALALGMIFLCEDTPTGRWQDRHKVISEGKVVDAAGNITDAPSPSASVSPPLEKSEEKITDLETCTDVKEIILSETVQAPTWKEAFKVYFSWQAVMLCFPYACSFGGELAINSILGAYYFKNFPHLGQTKSGRWAAMFGLLNVICRPGGGIMGDVIYRSTGSVSAKKFWLLSLGTAQGVMMIAIGRTNPHRESLMFGLVAGLALFMDASNGASFAVVPHVHPHANGILSGVVGAFGNLGGVLFSLVFRHYKTDYQTTIWIIGVVAIVVNVGVSWIRVIPKGQLGGR